MMKPLCIYHGNCADGFTAAWAVWKRFGDEFEYMPGIYGSPPPDVTGRIVVMVDFSYKKDVVLKMAETAESVLIIDHHKSAYEDLTGTPNERFFHSINFDWEKFCVEENYREDKNHRNIYTYFDMSRSGAGLAWDFFHVGVRRPQLVNYVEDRDLWKFALNRSKEISSYIFAHEYEFDVWEKLAFDVEYRYADVVRAGEAIEKKFNKDLKELLAITTQAGNILGHAVGVANLPYTMCSEAGNILAKHYDFGATFYINSAGKYVYSLRSIGDFDVSKLASYYGGGGHKNAAGFTTLAPIHFK